MRLIFVDIILYWVRIIISVSSTYSFSMRDRDRPRTGTASASMRSAQFPFRTDDRENLYNRDTRTSHSALPRSASSSEIDPIDRSRPQEFRQNLQEF